MLPRFQDVIPWLHDELARLSGSIRELARGLAIRGCDTQAPNIALTGVIFLEYLAGVVNLGATRRLGYWLLASGAT